MTARWRFEWIEEYDGVLSPSFLSVWEGIARRARNPHVFQEPQIARAWLETKGAALGVVPRFCRAVSDAGAEVLVPFCQVPHGRHNAWRRRLISVGEPHFDYQDPAAVWPEDGTPPWAEFWPSLNDELARKGRWEHAMLLRLGFASAPSDAAADTAGESPVLRIEAKATLDDVLKDRPAKHRTDVRRQIRRLQDLGRVDLHTYTPDELPAARVELHRLREAHERLWAGSAAQGLLRRPGTFAFYERLVEAALPALVHFSVLRVADRPVSWHFGFLRDGVLHWYKPTYEEDLEALSPGKVHLARLIELGLRLGWREIDLGGGTEAYKYLWTDDARPLAQWHWQADTWRERMYRVARRAYDCLPRTVAGRRKNRSSSAKATLTAPRR
jgi:CelD/BcsL family acetyltransferase involved in cellulose biosynthesis